MYYLEIMKVTYLLVESLIVLAMLIEFNGQFVAHLLVDDNNCIPSAACS